MNRAARRQQQRTSVRRRATVAAAAACLAATALGACSNSKDAEPLTQEQLCAELRTIDPGPSFAGDDAVALAEATNRINAIADRSPKATRAAMNAIAAAADKHPELRKLPDLEQGDEDYGTAYQSAYAFRFDRKVGVAAALLERYGVDECGLEPSGLFNIKAVRDSDLTAAAIPVLTQKDLEELRIEFEPADLEGHELKPFEIPPVQFERDLDEFKLQPNEKAIPESKLGK
jgi:hypothetical protein